MKMRKILSNFISIKKPLLYGKSDIDYIGVCAFLVGLLFTACEDAKNATIDNRVYFGEATSTKTTTLTLGDDGAVTELSVRMAQAAANDVTASITIDEAWLKQYNSTNQTNYECLPADSFTYTNIATIKAGDVSAEAINVNIPYFETHGKQYAIPLSISTTTGGVEATQVSSKIIIVLKVPLKQYVPRLTWYNASQAAPHESWGMSLNNYTLEWWSKVRNVRNTNGYTKNNQAIFNSGSGSTELYVRFGDLVYSQNGKYVYNFLQVKTMGSQFDSGDPTQGYGLQWGEWYHWAITYDATTGTTIMYKNGEKMSELKTEAGKPMIIDHLQMVCSGQTYFPDYCEMCQVRLWKTTRSDMQIQNNMYSEVDPTDENLILYLPMNEGEGATVFKDATGHGHDVKIGNISSSSSKAQNVTWTQYTFSK